MGMGSCQGFSHEEHTADVLIHAWGRTMEEAFEYAAKGVYEVITDTSKVKPSKRIDIRIEGIDTYNLLYRWIEEMLLYTDSEGMVFSIFRVCRIIKKEDSWIIESSVWGEPFNPEKHEHRTIVKAMTYAQMEIKEQDGCWHVSFVVDI